MTTIGPARPPRIDRSQVINTVRLSDIIAQTQEVKRDGREFVTLCPFHADKNPSLHINDEKGFAYCHPCGQHVNAIDWVMHTRGVDFKRACELIADIRSADGPERPQVQRKPKQLKYETFPVPPTVRTPDMSISIESATGERVTLNAVATWAYRNADGALIGYVARYVDLDGEKTIRTWTWGSIENRRPMWHCRRWARPYPLYGLEKLNQPGAVDKRVVLVSGEKTADAVQALMPESIVMTWCGGDDSARYADLEPIAGRANVILWPDADASGLRAQATLVDELSAMVRNLYVVHVEDMPKGWDGADGAEAGWSDTRLRQWLNELIVADELPRLRKWDARTGGPLVKPAPVADPLADEDRAEKEPSIAERFGLNGVYWKSQPWRHMLILGGEDHESFIRCDHNAAVPLRFAEELQGLLRFNELSGAITITRPLPWGDIEGTWRDDHTTRLSQWFNRIGINLSRDMIQNAVEAVARERPFNPVRDYLNSLQWDGVDRLDAWLPRYVGSVDSPYTRAVGSRWMISAAARGMVPGTQVDTMLVLEGPDEGEGKTSTFRVLGGDWFSPLRGKIGSDDGRAGLQAAESWILEFGELAATKGADFESLKDFLTTTEETLRRPFARNYERVRRVAVFAGTVNNDDWLPPSGNHRRFWPVRVGKRVDLAALSADRDQLWAEAVARYHAKEHWWIKSEEEELVLAARAMRESRKARDVWIEVLEEWFADDKQYQRSKFTTAEIAQKAIGIDMQKFDLPTQKRLAAALRALGMERTQVWDKEQSKNTKGWVRLDLLAGA
jgi:predicted P-loop ATPase